MLGKGISEPSIRFVPMSQVVFSGLELAQNIVGNKVGGMYGSQGQCCETKRKRSQLLLLWRKCRKCPLIVVSTVWMNSTMIHMAVSA